MEIKDAKWLTRKIIIISNKTLKFDLIKTNKQKHVKKKSNSYFASQNLKSRTVKIGGAH